MLNEQSIEFAEKILAHAAKQYPQVFKGRLFLEQAAAPEIVKEYNIALDYLASEHIIEASVTHRGYYKATTVGVRLAEYGGVKAYLEEVREEEKKEEELENLNLEKLRGEISKIRRDNRFWKWIAAAGALGLIIQILQLIFSRN